LIPLDHKCKFCCPLDPNEQLTIIHPNGLKNPMIAECFCCGHIYKTKNDSEYSDDNIRKYMEFMIKYFGSFEIKRWANSV
jgi:hypothetical protein